MANRGSLLVRHQAIYKRPEGNGRGIPAPIAEEQPPPDGGASTGPPWPGPLDTTAYHGLAGEVVRRIEPHTEGDPAAVLVQLLVAFGNLIGRTAYFRAESDRHYGNLFAVLVGETSKGRKGSSWGWVRRLAENAEQAWAEKRVATGLSSGEGLIWQCRDPLFRREPVREKGRVTSYQQVEDDPGEPDKRLLIFEPEFACVLKHLDRQGNTLSAILRQAWENGNLRTLTKHSPAVATGAHVSLIGHVTVDELRRYLSATETANGFGNRFLWLCVKRSKCLPEGGSLHPDSLAEFEPRLGEALQFGRQTGEMRRDNQAREIWREVYPQLSEGKPGLAGALTARAEAQVSRLSCLYALLDLSAVVRPEHLLAALALWEFCEQSVRFTFGDSLGDPVADEILQALRQRPEGLTRSAIRDYFGRHYNADRIGRALGLLLRYGLAQLEEEATGGRPAERWFAVRNGAPKATKAR